MRKRTRVTKRCVDIAIEKINDFGIEVRFARGGTVTRSQCWFVPSQSITVTRRGLHHWWVLMCRAHELGHCLSVRHGSLTTRSTQLRYSLKAPMTKRELLSLLAEERRAWMIGDRFLRHEGLPTNRMMRKARKILHTIEIRDLKP